MRARADLVDQHAVAHDAQRGGNADSAPGAIAHVHVLPEQRHVGTVAARPLAHARHHDRPERAQEPVLGLRGAHHGHTVHALEVVEARNLAR